jgi:hypothetical protein
LMEEIRVGFEPADVAVAAGRLMMDSRHREWDCEWIRHVKRRLASEDGPLRKTPLRVYRHAESGKWVLYEPLDNGYPMANEIHSMDVPPDRGGAPAPEILRLMLVGPMEANRRIKEQIQQRQSAARRKKADNLEQRTQAERYLKKQGMPEAAAFLKMGGYMGEVEGDRYHATVEKLKEAASGRIITSG